jgi:hypothetical protein
MEEACRLVSKKPSKNLIGIVGILIMARIQPLSGYIARLNKLMNNN